MHRAVDRFISEIRTAPQFVTAAESDPAWLDQLAWLERSLDAIFRSELAVAVEASDRIAVVVGDTATPLKQRLLAVTDIMKGMVKRDA